MNRTVAASRCLEHLKTKVGDALYSGHPSQAFMKLVKEMRAQNVVGSREELRELRREIVRDAIGLKKLADANVRALIRQLAQTPPRAAALPAKHPFGLGQSVLSYL